MGLHRRLDFGLVGFDRQQEVAAIFHDDGAGSRVLRVHRVEADEPAGQIEPLEQRARSRDLVGLGRDHFAAQKILAGRGDGTDHVESPAIGGHLAVEDDDLGGRRCAAHLALMFKQSALDARGREAFEQPAEGGLAGGRIFAVGGGAHAERGALG